MAKLIDIVMPVHNRPRLTRQTIESLYSSTNKDLFNLYVIDDGSDEETKNLVEEMSEQLEFFRFRNEKAMSPGWSRNYVCNLIKSFKDQLPYLYHSDNDVYFTQGWLSKLLWAYENAVKHDIILVGGGCHPYLQNKERIALSADTFVGTKDAVSGYSQLMDWIVWDKYGPFDETMKDAERKIMGSEDWAFCQKIIQDGYMVGAIEPEVVLHCGKTNTYGDLATGSETFKQYPNVIVE